MLGQRARCVISRSVAISPRWVELALGGTGMRRRRQAALLVAGGVEALPGTAGDFLASGANGYLFLSHR
jgi:hypothetical protein